MDITFHYPPELFGLLVEAIPRLIRSKEDVLVFFRGAGVDQKDLRDLKLRVETDRKKITKFEIVRSVLERINSRGEVTLSVRREVLKRVTAWEEFSGSWESEVYKAKALVGDIRRIVEVKDAFARMNLERERERRTRQDEHAEKLAATLVKKEVLSEIRQRLFALFGVTNPHRRGKALERVMNDLFAAYGILVRDSFAIVGDAGEGIVEQIDGVIELDGQIYLVELKWWAAPLGTGDISQHMVRVHGRGCARGLFISASGYSDAAKRSCRENSLPSSVFVLAELEEFVHLLEHEHDLAAFLKEKIAAAVIYKQPLFRPFAPEPLGSAV